jgi:hypothetical protein
MDPQTQQIDIGNFIVYPNEGKIKSKKSNKFLGTTSKTTGYVYVRQQSKQYAVHRMVYESFHGIKLQPQQQINHINRQKDDNRIINLELVTNQQNTQWTTNRTGNYKGAQ